MRDSDIAIYEGTNGVQALDLTARKLFMHDGRLVQRYFSLIEGFLTENNDVEGMEQFVAPLAQAFQYLQETTSWVNQASRTDPNVPGASSSDFLRLVALVTLALMWAQMAKVSVTQSVGQDGDFYKTKLYTARFYMKRLLPQAGALAGAIMTPSDTLMALNADAF